MLHRRTKTCNCCLRYRPKLCIEQQHLPSGVVAMLEIIDICCMTIPIQQTSRHVGIIELDHVADWAQANNLKLNRAKCAEIIISDSRRKPQFNSPPMLHDNDQLGQVLGVTITITYQSATMTTSGSVTMTTEVGTDGATTLSRMNLSGYVYDM